VDDKVDEAVGILNVDNVGVDDKVGEAVGVLNVGNVGELELEGELLADDDAFVGVVFVIVVISIREQNPSSAAQADP
jgi:hypothetical protein